MTGSVATRVAGQTLRLLPQRAAFWEEARTVLVADVHFGKAASFRAAGVPVPSGTTQADLDRLDGVVRETRATHLVILGDLLHARSGRAPGTLAAVARWRAAHPALAITLVRGNHDRHAGPAPDDWRVVEHAGPLEIGPFLLRHEPAPVGGAAPAPGDAYVLAGHIHPSVRLHGADGDSLRAPCFVLGPHAGLLPAFGSFTGNARMRPRRGDRVFVIGPDVVFEAPVRD